MKKMECFGKTDVGLRRSQNEDVFCVDLEKGFCLVADGMGGAAAGELASGLFAEAVRKTFSNISRTSRPSGTQLVKAAFQRANQAIIEHIREFPAHKGMGCTAELMVCSDDELVFGHIGDSRTYRYSSKKLNQITKDHSLVQQQMEEGLITTEEARNHPMRNVILKAVGISRSIEIDLIRTTPRPDDIYLMCSDGLTDLVDDQQISEVLAAGSGTEKKVGMLVDMAKTAGGLDNITVVICRIL